MELTVVVRDRCVENAGEDYYVVWLLWQDLHHHFQSGVDGLVDHIALVGTELIRTVNSEYLKFVSITLKKGNNQNSD